ncbi:hypothetical protein [Actinomadura madurae]|nr:hypothetical protein [Actinomadura madurae]MCP9952804.1 hypothetical protein [Actinomadura madurae]MCP9969567.1 hypothetical protein [Actinomadura madurae]MCP9982026.1 hypothetical protein [Actinomadura madurae]MCQ0006448.1 hypothetical protein [Actinomadura madurae]MCQ0018263.1 hypothetical protein [Actinomadura madurae]
MEERRARPDDLPFPASALHKTLIKLRVPRFMADHAAALLAANLRKRDTRGR